MSRETKTVLVTGGLGSIGHVLCAQLLEGGYRVIIVDDLSVGRREFLERLPDVQFYQCDIADYKNLEKVFSGNSVDAVVHLAAKHYIPYCRTHPKEATDTNVFGTLNVLLLMQQYRVSHLVFASTSSVYRPAEHSYKEDDALEPIDIYGISKLLCENAIRLYAPLAPFSYTILRFFNVYGPDDLVPHVIPELVKQARFSNVVRVGNLESKRDFIHVRDVVDAIEKSLVLSAARNATYNVGTGRAFSIREVFEALCDAAGKRLALEVEESRKRVSDPAMLLADIAKITTELGWRPDPNFSLKTVFSETQFWPA